MKHIFQVVDHDHTCALETLFLYHGHMYISARHICFYSTVFKEMKVRLCSCFCSEHCAFVGCEVRTRENEREMGENLVKEIFLVELKHSTQSKSEWKV